VSQVLWIISVYLESQTGLCRRFCGLPALSPLPSRTRPDRPAYTPMSHLPIPNSEPLIECIEFPLGLYARRPPTVAIGNIELTENMEFAHPTSISPSGAPRFTCPPSSHPALAKYRATLQLANYVALRHQLGVLGRAVKRPKLSSAESTLLGVAVQIVERLAICPGHRQTGEGHWLAPQRLQTFLDLESSSRSAWPTAGSERSARTDP